MKQLDAVLLGIVFVVWGALALMYATIPMIYMPSSIRVWGSGAVLFLVLTAVTVFREIEVVRVLQPLSTFAISLIAVTAGGHFSYRRLHNALRRILFIAVF